ncbi:MAG: DUF4350 domain-containing protein [Acidobacteria bacterium]|nr:DUF4350 domain-containing protein [Acidobacteriota bacterium]MCA1619766.1 DUF4350 domain-containing protein [Acidobacteriota bacterium]
MKSRLLIFVSFVVLVAVFAALNAASYVRVEEEFETEFAPDRSTQNSGGTGTRALFEYLKQSGHEVSRWGLPMSALDGPEGPQTLVMVGPLRREVEKNEADAVLRWVGYGGRLVLIDRAPAPTLLPPSGRWRIYTEAVELPGPEVLPHDAENMTRGVPLVSPAQPTALTRHVTEVTRSRFASRLYVYQPSARVGVGVGAERPTPSAEEDFWGGATEDAPPPEPPEVDDTGPDTSAPVVHLRDGREGRGALLVDYAYGRGRIVVLSDPYIVSNAGVNRADNLFLAVGVVTGGRRGRVAFDELHHGFGEARNLLFAYFSGTPVLWMFAQGALVALAVVWTRGRRFARALPAPRADRRSKLEFVSSMAELQQRARAYDLAVENIYQRTRRALARYSGLPATATAAQIAERVAARSGRDRRELEALLGECEDSAAGAPLGARRAVALARRLRELERDLGILMRSREIRQAR